MAAAALVGIISLSPIDKRSGSARSLAPTRSATETLYRRASDHRVSPRSTAWVRTGEFAAAVSAAGGAPRSGAVGLVTGGGDAEPQPIAVSATKRMQHGRKTLMACP